MPINFNPVLVNSSITANFNNRFYIVIPTANTNITLPLITCDGITLVLSREDATAFLVNILTTAPNVIRFSSDPLDNVSTYSLRGKSSIELTSFEGNWLVGQITYNFNNSDAGPKISGTLTCNNNPNGYFAYGNANGLITSFTFVSNSQPVLFSIVIANSSVSSIVGDFVIASDEVLTITYMSINVNTPPSTMTVYSTNVLLSSLTNGVRYYIGWKYTSGTSTVRIYCLYLA